MNDDIDRIICRAENEARLNALKEVLEWLKIRIKSPSTHQTIVEAFKEKFGVKD